LDFFPPCNRVLSPKVRFVTFSVPADFRCERIKKCKTTESKAV
jgi:hypothetical protein